MRRPQSHEQIETKIRRHFLQGTSRRPHTMRVTTHVLCTTVTRSPIITTIYFSTRLNFI